jgi:hypothetical protein
MFRNLKETIRALNANVNDIANCEKAKRLRKKLIKIGTTLAICGFLGVLICFVLFATAGHGAMGPQGFSARIIVPFILIIPCAVVGGIGAMLASLGFKIVITGYATNLINQTIGDECPNCGKPIESEMYFCSRCGTKIRKECLNCKHINHYKNDYCEKCGSKLD